MPSIAPLTAHSSSPTEGCPFSKRLSAQSHSPDYAEAKSQCPFASKFIPSPLASPCSAPPPAPRLAHAPADVASLLASSGSPVLYIPPLLSLLPPAIAQVGSKESGGDDTVKWTSSALPAIDEASRRFHAALKAFRPVTADYALVNYADAFNWASLDLGLETEREWYAVVFRSKRSSTSCSETLGAADLAAHEEAVSAGGLVSYWYGTPNSEGENLATCLWMSRAEAVASINGPHHIVAMRLAASNYAHFTLERRGLGEANVRFVGETPNLTPSPSAGLGSAPLRSVPNQSCQSHKRSKKMSDSLSAFRLPAGKSFLEAQAVEIIDQLQLPHVIEWEKVDSIDGAFDAIKSMKIRGAPAIASLASLGIASELLSLTASPSQPTKYFPSTSLDSTSSLNSALLEATSYLLSSRPTAVNLREGLDRIEASSKECVESGASVEDAARRVIEVAVKVWEDDRERNVAMGDAGAQWILERSEREGRIEKGGKVSVLTVCNTGSLATSAYGTAFGVITSLHKLGRLEMAYFAQTGPYQQGARLTALELAAIGAPHTMVCDTAIGALIAEKPVHLFVAGADRITANGDTANKVSTFQIATMCRAPHPFSPNPPIPVLVAAPVTTLDLTMPTGRSIVIEQRPSSEATTVRGRVVDGAAFAKEGVEYLNKTDVRVETVLITPPGTVAYNPAFDVTPASYIEGIVTELGVAVKKEGEKEFDLKSFVESGGKQ